MALIVLPCNNCLSKNCQWFSLSILQGAKEEKPLKVPIVAEHLQQIAAVFCQWGKWKTALIHFQSAITSAKTALHGLHGKGFPALFFPQVSWKVHGLPAATILPLGRHFAHSTLLERPRHQRQHIFESGMLREMFIRNCSYWNPPCAVQAWKIDQ